MHMCLIFYVCVCVDVHTSGGRYWFSCIIFTKGLRWCPSLNRVSTTWGPASDDKGSSLDIRGREVFLMEDSMYPWKRRLSSPNQI